MLPGETVSVLVAGTVTDPDSGEALPDWDTATETQADWVLVGWTGNAPFGIDGAVATTRTLYFQLVPLVPLAGTRIRVRGQDYAVVGQPSDWRMGDFRALEVPVEELLATKRASAEALMSDTCRLETPTGSTTTDAGAVSTTYTTLYVGRCRVVLHGTTIGAGTSNVGDQEVSVLTVEVQLPVVGSEGIHVRDRITILRSTNDADLVGRQFRVLQPSPSSDAAARALQCLEVTA